MTGSTGLLWTAPELLRTDIPSNRGSQPGDVYSFSIILQEIIYRDMPYFMNDTPPKGNRDAVIMYKRSIAEYAAA